MDQELRIAVEAARRDQALLAKVGEIYRELQARIDERRPVCRASGACCRFEEYGHRLYVTTVELAAFAEAIAGSGFGVQGSVKRGGTSLPVVSGVPGGCVFQVEGLCSVHAIRPFGCRVFFCDETATEWQRGQYEAFHGRLKALHESAGVPYYYVEWRAALRALGFAPSS